MHVELALTWCEIGKFDRAREHYRRAMQIDQSLAPAPAGAAAGDRAGSGTGRVRSGTLRARFRPG